MEEGTARTVSLPCESLQDIWNSGPFSKKKHPCGKICYALMRPIPIGIIPKCKEKNQNKTIARCRMVVVAWYVRAAFLQPWLGLLSWGILEIYKYQSTSVHNFQIFASKLKMKRDFTFQHDNDPKACIWINRGIVWQFDGSWMCVQERVEKILTGTD